MLRTGILGMLLRAGEVNSEISFIGGNLLSGLKEVCGQIIFFDDCCRIPLLFMLMYTFD